jgi:putative N6-adenine-specific DNA methylase
VAGDVSPAALSATRENALMAGVEPALTLRRERFQDALPPSAEGVLVTNPPYGERLQPEDIERLYAAFGDALKQHWGGWRAWLFSANIDALKRVGLKPARRIPLRNANLEARLYGFELYAGSRKGTEG